jgi:hypothetical protein
LPVLLKELPRPVTLPDKKFRKVVFPEPKLKYYSNG